MTPIKVTIKAARKIIKDCEVCKIIFASVKKKYVWVYQHPNQKTQHIALTRKCARICCKYR